MSLSPRTYKNHTKPWDFSSLKLKHKKDADGDIKCYTLRGIKFDIKLDVFDAIPALLLNCYVGFQWEDVMSCEADRNAVTVQCV